MILSSLHKLTQQTIMNTADKDTKAIQQELKNWKLHSGSWLKIAVGLGLVSGLLLIVQAWLLAHVVSDVLFEEATLADVQIYLLCMLLVFALRALLAWASEQAAFHAAIRVKLYLRDQLYRHVQKLGPAWLSGERSGDVLNALSDGIEGLEAYYARYIPAMSLMALVPLAILVFVFAHDWLAGLIMVATAPLIPFFMIIIGKGTEKRNQKQWKSLAKMSAHFLDVIQGLTTLKLFNASRREANMVAKISEEYRQSTMSVLRVAFLSSFMLEFLATVSIALVAVSIGFRLFWGDMDFYYGFFVLLLAPEFYLPLRNMGTQYHARMEAIGAGERIIEILNTPVHLSAKDTSPNPSSKKKNLNIDSQPPSIHIQDLSFVYPDGREAINNLNLSIPAGKTVALVGTSGAGKSTLLNLLMGFLQPSSGQVLVNNTVIHNTSPSEWRQNIAWLPQKPQLFPGTIIENIALGQTDFDDDRIRHAAEKAQALDFIENLPNKFETLIGEGGQGLSGGQIQRIALARAFYKDAPLVFLDEATANLDMDSEKRVQKGINELLKDRTAIMIAHRLKTVENVDLIAVMQQGQIIQTGTHSELLATCPEYLAMVTAYGGDA